MEADSQGEWGGLTHYDYGFRIYNPSIAKFLSVDPLMGTFPSQTPYLFANNSPIKFLDVMGLYGGEQTRSLTSFIAVIKAWEVEALKHKNSNIFTSNRGVRHKIPESDSRALLRIFNHDITSLTKNQIVTSVSGIKGTFSYYQNFGKDKAGAFVDVGGFPLDLKHFMKNVSIGNDIGETMGNKVSVDEEYWQSIDPNADHVAKTSSFSPEDLLSNSLGLIFSRYDDDGNFSGDLEGMLEEAATLFSTNNLENGKYITNSDVSNLRNMIKEYHGTDNFTDFIKSSSLYDESNNGTRYEAAAAELEKKPVYKAYLEYIHPKN